MGKCTDSLLFRFGLIFMVFTFAMLIMSGIATYACQNKAYKLEREKSIQEVATYLENILLRDGEDFVWYLDYFLAHSDTLLIPMDFGQPEIEASRNHYEKLFAQKYPGKVLGSDISFEELSDDVKEAYTVYKHEYYLDKFEQARESFHLIYTYFLVPQPEEQVTYALDALREAREEEVDGKKYIELAITVENPVEEHPKEWEAWNTGKRPKGYDTFDNEYGKTYAFYTPVIIHGRKLGIIGVEVAIALVNQTILRNTIRQMCGIGGILILCVAVLLFFIYKHYIAKLEHLQRNIGDYTQRKDAPIATEIERDATGEDEISALAKQFSFMVLELENYMKSLVETTKELRDSRQHAAIMSDLATKDALTGIRNKTSYDKDVARLEWEIADGRAEFGIAMVDLNFLKRINDTYGHEQGNFAIKKLCYIVCHIFEHSPVFRIGGDEFVIILENDDYREVDTLIETFNARLDEISKEDGLEVWERVSASIGYAKYDASVDASVANVFKRADKAMYARKKEMKAVREN